MERRYDDTKQKKRESVSLSLNEKLNAACECNAAALCCSMCSFSDFFFLVRDKCEKMKELVFIGGRLAFYDLRAVVTL